MQTPGEQLPGKKNPPVQKDLIADGAKRILAATGAAHTEWTIELGKPHIMASGEYADYCRLEAHLKRYTARNSFDYFIHKDLRMFLRRELDFYIKNEVMHLDDVENESAPRVEQYLSKIKIIRKIASKIIDFLAQLEDFQKILWLKKKFIIETQYCIIVGIIPEEFYTEIVANEAQREEWVTNFAIDEIKGDLTTPGYSGKLDPEFLMGHPTLVADTRHFEMNFTARLLETIENVSEEMNGVLFHGENFQALSLVFDSKEIKSIANQEVDRRRKSLSLHIRYAMRFSTTALRNLGRCFPPQFRSGARCWAIGPRRIGQSCRRRRRRCCAPQSFSRCR